MIDLSKDSNPKHYKFVDEDGDEHEVTGIEFDEDEEEDGLAYDVLFKDDDGYTDSYWVARNGDSKGLDGTLSYVGHLIPVAAGKQRGVINMREKHDPSNLLFAERDGNDYQVTKIEKHSTTDHWRVYFRRSNGNIDYWNVEEDGDAGSYGYVYMRKPEGKSQVDTELKIFNDGEVEANPNDIQIHYEDMGNTIKLTNVVNIWSAPEMYHKFGIDWFDRHYRKSTPKVDFNCDTIYIQEGACDYPSTKRTKFVIGKTYDKETFLMGMELVQQAAQNLSRLRKEFGLKKKTITI